MITLAVPKATITLLSSTIRSQEKNNDPKNYFGQTAYLQYCIASNSMEIIVR